MTEIAAKSSARTRRDVHLAARVDAPLADEVRRIAIATDRPASSILRLAVREYVDRHREAPSE